MTFQGADAQIERCPQCGGVFAEFFDGELSSLARAVPRQGSGDSAALSRGCPGCGGPLELAQYLSDGPSVYRCGSCMGSFLTSVQISQLRDYPRAPEPEGVLDRLFHRLFGD